MMRFLFSLSIILFSLSARAGVLLDFGGGYYSDTLTTSSSDQTVKTAYNAGVYLNITKKVWGGWSYSAFTTQDSRTNTNNTLSGTDTGPALKWIFGRGKSYSLGAIYNILSRASYSTQSSSEEWEGTSYCLQFAAMPELKEGLHLGFSLNYFSANYTKRKVNNTESNVSYTKNWFFPTLSLTKEF